MIISPNSIICFTPILEGITQEEEEEEEEEEARSSLGNESWIL